MLDALEDIMVGADVHSSNFKTGIQNASTLAEEDRVVSTSLTYHCSVSTSIYSGLLRLTTPALCHYDLLVEQRLRMFYVSLHYVSEANHLSARTYLMLASGIPLRITLDMH